MDRRKFIQGTSILTAQTLIMKDMFAKTESQVYGHNNMERDVRFVQLYHMQSVVKMVRGKVPC